MKLNNIPSSRGIKNNKLTELRTKIKDFYTKVNKKERIIDGLEFECATACGVLSSDRDEDILIVSDPTSSVILKIEIK